MPTAPAVVGVVVRPFRREDFEALWDLAQQMHAESPHYQDWPMDRGKLQRLAELAVDSPQLMCGLVAEEVAGRDEGRLRGVFLGSITEPYFGPGRMAVDLALFVPTNRRGGMAAAALVRAYEAWARAHGAQVAQLGITTGVHHESTAALYQRLGFELFGIVCRKQLNHGG